MLVQLGHKTASPPAPPSFLPTSLSEAHARGWDQLDVVIVTGDAYVDHPAFGPVLIARFLEHRGLRVGLLAQPDWRSPDDFRRLGRPRLFFGVSAGNLDSMLNRLTAQKKSRVEDPYSPGGRPGARPDRATLVYANRCRQAFPDVPIVLGGIEASLRRIAHYDYWSDTVRRPVLLDAKADLLVFGSGERPIWEVSQRLQSGQSIGRIRDVPGTAFALPTAEADACLAAPVAPVLLPTYEEVAGRDPASLRRYAEMARIFHQQSSPYNGRALLQPVGNRAVYFNPPSPPLSGFELASCRDLPFVRRPHPSYVDPIPAFEELCASPPHPASEAGHQAARAPNFIAGYPGSTLPDTIEFARFLKRNNLRPRTIQDFIPTPMSLAATLYYTGLDPWDDSAARPVQVPPAREKRLHRALILYWDRSHHDLAREALHRAGRPELIGQGPDCLIP